MAKLTAEQISEVYAELGTMTLDLDPNPNRGLQYVKERMALCKALRDRLGELTLRCNRAYSDAFAEELSLKMQYALAESAALEQRCLSAKGEVAEHKILLSMLAMQRQLLAKTTSDVKLLATLTIEQIKLGEIDPKDAGLVHEVAIADLSPVASTSDAPSAGLNDAEINVTLAHESAILTEMTGGQSPDPVSPEAPVNFEDLFGVLDAETTPRIY